MSRRLRPTGERRASSRDFSFSAVLTLLLAVVAGGCAAQRTEPTKPAGPTVLAEPTQVGEPLPGSFHLTSDPPLAPYPLSIRIDDIGGPSGRSAEFEGGDEVVVDWSTLPELKWIEVNGQDCDGTFRIQARFEVDLLLTLTDDGCNVQILGVHLEGGAHVQPRE